MESLNLEGGKSGKFRLHPRLDPCLDLRRFKSSARFSSSSSAIMIGTNIGMKIGAKIGNEDCDEDQDIDRDED